MRAVLSQKHPDWLSDPVDPDGEAETVLYLRALAEGRVFDLQADPSALLSGSETLDSILKTAIGLEKDSIIFYIGIKDVVPADLGKNRIDAIIREEMTHITILDRELAALQGPA